MKITDFLIMDGNGDLIDADPHGDNIAFSCLACGHPVLAIAGNSQRGSDEEHAAICKGCGQKHFLDVREHTSKLYIHTL